MPTHLAIMDYSACTVSFYTIPDEAGADTDATEKWIAENTCHRISDISYMTSSEEIEIRQIEVG